MLSADKMRYAVRYQVDHRGHSIIVKQDFGDSWHLIDGMPCAWGYVVVKDGCNAMPAAIWFQTVRDAKAAIDILIQAEGDAQKFWVLWRARQARV